MHILNESAEMGEYIVYENVKSSTLTGRIKNDLIFIIKQKKLLMLEFFF